MAMGIESPDLLMKNIIPVVMAGGERLTVLLTVPLFGDELEWDYVIPLQSRLFTTRRHNTTTAKF